jgi:hypothetical protein
MMRSGCALALVLVAICIAGCAAEPQPKQVLAEVYMPTFGRVPPAAPATEAIQTLAADWRAGARESFVNDVLSVQGRFVAIALAVILAVAWDFRRSSGSRNVELALLFASGALFFDVMRFFDVIRKPAYLTLLDWVFSAVMAVGLALIVRAVLRARRESTPAWTPNLQTGALIVLAGALLCSNLWIVMVRTSDDAGYFVNLGAQRLRERGRLPYGDPMLTGTPGAAYGPLLYAAHVPFQVIVSPGPVNAVSPARLDPSSQVPYYLPPARATQLAAAAFHLLGIAALFAAARGLADLRTALALVCLYSGSLGVLGIGGSGDQVAGLTFVSHIAPAATTLAAFAALRRPALSGLLLAAAAGVGFYPAFMAPAWLGHYWHDRARRTAFVLGFGLAAAVVVAGVFALSQPANGRTRTGTILYDTFGHHTDPAGYGSSPFGFWGQRGGLRRLLVTPIVGQSGLTSPAWLMFAAFLCSTFALARGRRPAALAALAGAVALGATLVKPHATGTYLAWFYPLLLLGFLADGFTSDRQKV